MSRKVIPAAGTLGDLSVNRLLHLMMEKGLSGCLVVTRGKVSRKLYVKNGMITYASSSESRDRLGEIFIAQGTLSRKAVATAFKRSLTRKTQLGMMLLVEGNITLQELFQGVTAQVVTILERMRSWRKGDFTFEADRAPVEGTVLLRIPLSLYLGTDDKKRRAVEPPEVIEEETSPADEEEKEPPPEEVEVELPPEKIGVEGPPPVEQQVNDDLEGPGIIQWEEEVPPEDIEVSPEELEVEVSPEEVGIELPSEEVEVELPSVDDGSSSEGGWRELVFPEQEQSEEADEKVNAEISFHVQELRRRTSGDPGTLLGVKEGASADEIREAYHYLARLLHPDHHPASLPDEMAGEAGAMFGEVSAAYEQLNVPPPVPPGDVEAEPADSPQSQPAASSFTPPPGRISAPDGRARTNGEALDQGDESRRHFYRAKQFIAKGNYWQAADSMRHVVRQKPKDAAYRNLLGFCLMQTGRRLHEAEEHIKEAIRLESGNPDFLTNLAMVYKAGHFYTKARNMLLQALLYDKQHVLARQELKNLPREIDRSKKSGAFWKKLFGK